MKKVGLVFVALVLTVLCLFTTSCVRDSGSVLPNEKGDPATDTSAGFTTTDTGSVIPDEQKKPVTEASTDPTTDTGFVTVRFFSNGGTGYIDAIQLKEGATFILPESGFAREGYRLIGFSRNPESSVAEFALGGRIVLNDSLDLYAVWDQKLVTLHFDPGCPDALGYAEDITVVEGTRVALPSLPYSRPGYTFCGWTTVSGGATASLADGGIVTASHGTTYYAVWKETEYLLTYRGDTGSHSVAVGATSGITVASADELGFCKEGFDFVGWSVVAGSEPVYMPGDQISLEADRVLYAVFTPKHYLISFSRPDTASGDMAALDVAYGEEVSLPECTFIKSLWHFTGWVLNGKSFRPGDTFVVTGDTSVRAEFAPNTSFTLTANVSNPVKVTFLDAGQFIAYDLQAMADLDYFTSNGYRALVKVSFTVSEYNRAEIHYGVGTSNERIADMKKVTRLSETVFRTYTGTFVKHDLQGAQNPHLEADLPASSFSRYLYFAFDVDSGVCEWIPSTVYAVVSDITITIDFYR